MQTLTDFEWNDAALADLAAELRPEGVIESFFAAQILCHMRRLRRYESLDENPDLEKARFRLGTFLRRDLAELRRLQSERQIRATLDSGLTGLASTKELVQAARAAVKPGARSKNEPNEADVRDIEARLEAHFTRTDNLDLRQMKKRSQSASETGRNAQCPCGSGQKFKRCCGVNAPAKLNLSPRKFGHGASPMAKAS